MNVESIIETDFQKLRPDMDLAGMVKAISLSTRNLFPVVGVQGEFLGMVNLDDVRNVMFRQELYHKYYVERFMKEPKAIINTTDSMEVKSGRLKTNHQ